MLQSHAVVTRHPGGGQRTEAGGDAVMRGGVVGQALDEVRGPFDPLYRVLSHGHLGSQPSDCDDVAGSERGTGVNGGWVHGHPFLEPRRRGDCVCDGQGPSSPMQPTWPIRCRTAPGRG